MNVLDADALLKQSAGGLMAEANRIFCSGRLTGADIEAAEILARESLAIHRLRGDLIEAALEIKLAVKRRGQINV